MDGWIKAPERHRSPELIAGIYAGLNLSALAARATLLLRDHRLERDHPLITGGKALNFSRRVTRLVRACNVFAEIMQVPAPADGDDFTWATVTGNDASPFSGPVYSMDVDRDLHYVADGLVTHNCWYAVRKTGKGHWAGDRKQTTLWTIPSRDQDATTVHGTQKPVECMRRPILNNSSPARRSTSRSWDPAPPSSPPRPPAASASASSSARPTSMWPSTLAAVHRQTATLDGTGQSFEQLTAERAPG